MKQYYNEIVNTLHSIEQDLILAENKLNYTNDELLIDSIIFEMESLYKRHAYYLKICKELNITAGEGYAV